MSKILLAAEALDAAGGVGISVQALSSFLTELGHEVFTGLEESHQNHAPFDLIWTHMWHTQEGQDRLQRLLKDHRGRFWVQLHDYRDMCLTARKCFGDELTECHFPLSSMCMAWHFLGPGCGKGRNPIKMTKRYRLLQDRLETIRQADRVLVFSEYMAHVARYNQIDHHKIQVTPPWQSSVASPQFIRPEISGPVEILWVGRVVPEKGTQEFVQIVQNIIAQYPGKLRATVIGDGTDMPKIKRQLAGVPPTQIELLGWLGREEIFKRLQKCHAVVCTSIWPEPYGLMGVEAMAQGRMSIAYHSGGVETWCTPSSGGILIDPHRLEDTLLTFIQDPEMVISRGERAWNEFQNHYSRDQMLQKLRQLMVEC